MGKPDGNLDRPPAAPMAVETLSELLAPETEVEFAYLFGSLAKGRPREASDVDMAVHLGGGGSPSDRLDRGLELEGHLEEALGRTVQVFVLNDAPLDLRFNVLHHGIPMQAWDRGARTRFFVDTGRRYYDMAPARELFGRRRTERIRQGSSVVEPGTVRRLLETIEQRLERMAGLRNILAHGYADVINERSPVWH